jgi:GT2 family glycosyltransferase
MSPARREDRAPSFHPTDGGRLVPTAPTHVFVLNYNGREWLRECLPSVIEAARQAPMPCGVTVIDNASTDGTLEGFERSWPGVGLARQANRGLVSFNHVLAGRCEDVVLLLNNDVKLAPDAIGPLVEAVRGRADAFFSAPQCWTFDGSHYEGMRTRVRMRFGLVQGMARVPGHEAAADRADLTAAAGPVLAVDLAKFLELGGYDPIYFPGRIEDLDLGYRAWLRGWTGLYVPEALAWHHGFGSFGPAFGNSGCDRLALRNTLLFCWKNLDGLALRNHLAWLPLRVAHWGLCRRDAFAALGAALARLEGVLAERRARRGEKAGRLVRQAEFFERFAW